MTTTENSYPKPLLLAFCREQGLCCMSSIGVVTVTATIEMRSSDWYGRWCGSTQVSGHCKRTHENSKDNKTKYGNA
jgi:hypothetical protein